MFTIAIMFSGPAKTSLMKLKGNWGTIFLRSENVKLTVALTLGMSFAAYTSMIEQAEVADVTDEAFGRQLHAEYLELAKAEKA